jgi:hypothetical protein
MSSEGTDVGIIQADLDQVCIDNPDLDDWGLASDWCRRRNGRYYYGRDTQPLRYGPPSLSEVQDAARWLAVVPRVKHPRRSSYELKHVMERLTGQYVTNGAFIAAALLLGIPVRRDPDSPNPFVGIARGIRF